MTFKFYCRHCGQHIEADDFMAGTTDQCPSCHHSILVMPEVATNTVVLRQIPGTDTKKAADEKEKDRKNPQRPAEKKKNGQKTPLSLFTWAKLALLLFFLLNLLWFLAWLRPVRWEYKTTLISLNEEGSSWQEQTKNISRTLNQENGKWELFSVIPAGKNAGGEPLPAMLIFRTRRFW